MAAVAQTESQLDPLAIGDNTAHRSYRPQTKAEAVAVAQRLMAERHDLDVGLMQINQRNFGWLRLTLEDAFDPCRSIVAGATVLTAFSRYNTGTPTAGFANGYVARVVSAASGVELPRAQTKSTPNTEDPPQGSGVNAWNVFPDEAADAQPDFLVSSAERGSHGTGH